LNGSASRIASCVRNDTVTAKIAATVLDLQEEACFSGGQAIDTTLFKRKSISFRTEDTIFIKKINNVKFFNVTEHEIGAEGPVRIDLAVATGEDNPGCRVFSACPVDKTPDVPFGAVGQRAGVDDDNVSIF
jgi:hypothetical protein